MLTDDMKDVGTQHEWAPRPACLLAAFDLLLLMPKGVSLTMESATDAQLSYLRSSSHHAA